MAVQVLFGPAEEEAVQVLLEVQALVHMALRLVEMVAQDYLHLFLER